MTTTLRTMAAQLNSQADIWRLRVYNNKLYGSTGAGGRLFEWDDVSAWVEKAGALNSQTNIYGLAPYNNGGGLKLYGGTGENARLFQWNDVNAWSQVAPTLAANDSRALSLLVFSVDGKLYCSMRRPTGNPLNGGQLYKWNDVNAWVQVAGPPVNYLQEINDLVEMGGYIFGGGGNHYSSGNGAELFRSSGGAWTLVASAPGSSINDTIQGLAVFNGKVYGIGTGTIGGKLLEWNAVNAWVEVAPALASRTAGAALMVFKGQLYGLASGALLRWNGTNAWTEVAAPLESAANALCEYKDQIFVGGGVTGTLMVWTGTVETAAASAVGPDQATGNGVFLDAADLANFDEYGFEWGVVSGTYTGSATTVGTPGSVNFSQAMTGLAQGRITYYRAKAHHTTYGWIYGAELSFWTTIGGTSVLHEGTNTGDTTGGSFRLGSNVLAAIIEPINSHWLTAVRLKLFRTGSPGGILRISLRATDVNGKPTGANIQSVDISPSVITTVSPGQWYDFGFTTPQWVTAGTKYAIVALMTAGDGSNFMTLRSGSNLNIYQWASTSSDGGTTWGAINPTTDYMVEEWGLEPVGATAAATGVTKNQATGNATLDNNDNLDQYGFEWRTYTGAYGAGSVVVNAQPGLSFSADMTGLDPATLYFFRAKVHHATDGWIYIGYAGREQTFDTLHDDDLVTMEAKDTGDTNHTDFKVAKWQAMTFTPSFSHQLKSVRVKLWRTTLAFVLGDLTISIRAVDGGTGKPTGADLISRVWPSTLITTVSPGQLYEFGLGAGILLTAGLSYAIVCRVPNGDASNFVWWRYGSGYAGGQNFDSLDSGGTWTARGNDLLFTEYGESGVETQPASNIQQFQATGNGYLNDPTNITSIGFKWGTTPGGPYPNTVTDPTVAVGNFALEMTGLSAGQVYYYRATAVHSLYGELAGQERSFTTLTPLPAVQTDPPTSISTDQFTAAAQITSIGGANCDKRGVVYGLTSVFADPGNVAPGASGYDSYSEELGTFGVGAFSALVIGLQANRIYYVRAWTHNSYGYAYGAEIPILTNSNTNILFPNSDASIGIRFSTSPGGGYPNPGGGGAHWPLVLNKDTTFQTGGYWGFFSGNFVYERNYFNSNMFTDIYGLTDPTRRTEGIIKVKWKARFFRSEYPFGKFRRQLLTHAVTYQGALTDINPPTLYGDTECEIFYTNPNTGLPWTVAECDALQGGISVGEAASFGIALCDWFQCSVHWANAAVRCDPATRLSGTSIRLNGFVLEDEAEECQVAFEWGETIAYGTTTTPESKRLGEFFTADLTGLDGTKTYHFRAKITTACGETFYSADASFNLFRPDRVYVWLGTVATPETFELTDPALPLALGVRTERGRDEELGHAAAGTAEIIGDNFNGDFSPENAAGAYFGTLVLGAVITVYEIYKGVQYNHFKGKIDKIVPDDNPKEAWAYILAVDGMDDLAGTEVDTPLRTTTDAGTLVEDVLDAASDAEPRSIDAGSDILEIGWFHKANALESVNELEETEKGFFYIDIDGTRIFENRHHRLLGAHLTSQHDFTDEVVELKYEFSKRDLRNSVRVSGYRYTKEAASHLLWSTWSGGLGAPYVDGGATLELWASMAGPIESFTTPVANTHWNANSANDGSGTNLTSKVSLVVTQYGQALKLAFTSTANQRAYLVPPTTPPAGAPADQTALVYGYLYDEGEMTVQKEDAASVLAYGKRSYDVDAKFKANPNDIQSYADWLLLRYKSPIPTPVGVKLVARTNWPDDTIRIQCLVRKISDRITLQSTRLAFDKDFFIDKVVQDYLFLEGGVRHETTWFVVGSEGSAEGAFWLLGVAGFSELGETTILGF